MTFINMQTAMLVGVINDCDSLIMWKEINRMQLTKSNTAHCIQVSKEREAKEAHKYAG